MAAHKLSDQEVEECLYRSVDTSSCSATCSCGITHYTDDMQGAESCRRGQESSPERYSYNYRPIVSVLIDGRVCVVGCSCGAALRYGHQLWNQGPQIARFFACVASKHSQEAAEARRVSAELVEAING